MKATLLILLVVLSAVSQTSAEIIRDIRIINQAGETYDISSVRAFTSFEIGQEVNSLETIRRSIGVDVNRMRDSGRYSYVDAHMDVGPDGVDLIYTVVTRNKLRRISVSGADHLSNKKVRKKSELTIGAFVGEAAFAQAAVKIKEAYRDAWHPEAEVTWTSTVDEQLGVVDVNFRVDEGARLVIKKLVLEGNAFFTDKELRKVLQQKEKGFFSFITSSGKYKPDMTDLDAFSLKSLYMNEGFLDVTVDEAILDDREPKKGRLIYRIREGRRYTIGRISIEGMERFTEEELRRGILLRTGDVAAYREVERGTESVKAFYGNRGYIETRVQPIFDADAEKGTVDVRYSVEEGEIAYIRHVNISGNERTHDKVIRRELVVYPGEKYNRSRVRTSENRLRNLNFFESVSAIPARTEVDDQYDLTVRTKEKSTGRFMAGVGFSSVESLVGYVELAQGNFSLKDWPPIGAGQKFKVRATVGTELNEFDISFVEPWFLDRKLSFGVDLFHRERRFLSDIYDQKNDGMRLSLGKPLSRFVRGTLAYTIEQFDVFDVQESSSDAIKAEEGKRLKSGLDFTLSRDTRDRFFNPTRGSKLNITPYFAGGPLGAETDIYGAKVRAAKYWPLVGDMVFNLRGQIETVDHYGDSAFVPIFDRLFLGGSYTLRGYEFRDVGPKDQNGEPVGGNSSSYATAELTYPIWNQIRGAFFYDWGFVNVDEFDFDPNGYNDNWGIGLRLDLPGFPLHLDYAWPITYDEDQSGKGRFNFLIGNTF